MNQSFQDWFRENSSEFSGQILFDELLSRYTYYRIGGPASVLAIPKTIEDLKWLAQGIQITQTPFFLLGKGSNLLVSDKGYKGLVIRASRINLEIETIEVEGSLRIRTGGSVAVSTLLRRASQEGWDGLEFLTGIPGSIGGIVTMNAGTHLGEVQKNLRKVETFSLLDNRGKNSIYDESKLKYQYRKNLFLPSGDLILAAEWEVQRGNPVQVKSKIDETLARRKATQPIDYPSCGSVFKNPKSHGISAWQVIDQLGLRGFRIGDAQFSEKHSNFIINLGNATAADVQGLISLAKTRALQDMQIFLEEEVIYLGF